MLFICMMGNKIAKTINKITQLNIHILTRKIASLSPRSGPSAGPAFRLAPGPPAEEDATDAATARQPPQMSRRDTLAVS